MIKKIIRMNTAKSGPEEKAGFMFISTSGPSYQVGDVNEKARAIVYLMQQEYSMGIINEIRDILNNLNKMDRISMKQALNKYLIEGDVDE